MKALIAFKISESQQIHIAINEQDKINTYGYETNGLHIFDEVDAEYVHDGKAIILISDSARYVVETLCASLEMALKNELPLDASLAVGKVGCFFSKKKYMTADESDESEKKDDIFSQYWVWSSSKNIQTWLYNVNNKIYLEISPTYPWLFSDPQEDEHYISFDEYMNDYRSITLVELQESLVRSWITECHVLLQTMETV
ncbi:MAG TPA: hypothetical protein VJJ26_05625 [Candidatus Babeliales bacterium]|nr:hypothetical protein [Candidatus Babeliales bacterium]